MVKSLSSQTNDVDIKVVTEKPILKFDFLKKPWSGSKFVHYTFFVFHSSRSQISWRKQLYVKFTIFNFESNFVA